MKKFISKSQKIGEIGENIACKYLINKGFSIIDRNYTQKWGEIDIVAKKSNKLYFIEVKSKSISNTQIVSYETNRPEDNLHYFKRKRLGRTIETYLIHNRIGNTEWQFDLLVVYIDLIAIQARVQRIENIIL